MAFVFFAVNHELSMADMMFKGFMREGQILEQQEIDKIRHIPTIVVQGRYDCVCPVSVIGVISNFQLLNYRQATTAWALKKAWPEITLHIIPDAGHSSRETGTAKKLVEATDKFADL